MKALNINILKQHLIELKKKARKVLHILSISRNVQLEVVLLVVFVVFIKMVVLLQEEQPRVLEYLLLVLYNNKKRKRGVDTENLYQLPFIFVSKNKRTK
jgi:hypothetical protein